MIFSSWQFIFAFLPIAFLVYFGLTRVRLITVAKLWLVGASLFFYAYWNITYLPLILVSMMFNYGVGTGLAKTHPEAAALHSRFFGHFSRKSLLVMGVAANLLLLGYFKYTNFFLSNFNTVFDTGYSLPDIALPLAISFFTFQQIAYLADSYSGRSPEYDMLNYALFVSFFPQLIAGPIVHHHEMMAQFASRRAWFVQQTNIVCGLFIFSIGLFKKVVLADTFSIWADSGFDSSQPLDFFAAWGASLSYTFQLYFDFSGYCDMAIGAALLFNIRLPINFNSPYKALSIQDFWRRWHITLSRFLRDYVYVPLGGNRKSALHTYLNLFATFLLGGLWHGASWMFVVWGALHGGALVVHRFWQGMGLRLPGPLAWLVTFVFVVVSWVFFRAQTMDDALRVLRGMGDVGSIYGQPLAQVPTNALAWGGWLSDRFVSLFPVSFLPNILTYMAISCAFLLLFQRNSIELTNSEMTGVKTLSSALLFCLSVYFVLAETSTVFLYFNF